MSLAWHRLANSILLWRRGLVPSLASDFVETVHFHVLRSRELSQGWLRFKIVSLGGQRAWPRDPGIPAAPSLSRSGLQMADAMSFPVGS